MKYDLPDNQNEVLPNIQGLKTVEEIALSEFEGFLKAEIQLTESLTQKTKFNVPNILKIHKLALGHLYSFCWKISGCKCFKRGIPFCSSTFFARNNENI